MTNNYFLFYLLILLFSSLAACGKSNSRSSGDTEQKKCDDIISTTTLKEGESCQIDFGMNAGIYKCQLGEVINEKGQVMSANGTWLSLEDSTAVIIHCESE